MIERERKFLVKSDRLPLAITQALVADDPVVCREMQTGYFTNQKIAVNGFKFQ